MHSTGDKSISARPRGFTIVESMLGIAILGVLVGIAYPSYQQYTERVRIAQAIIDIQDISASVEAYSNDNREYPDDLNEVGKGGMKDPGATLPLHEPQGRQGLGGRAVLCSAADGASVPLTAKASRDDIVRASDGRFVGLASDYDP
jgi:general secretion pathway protein G